jgi:hypothetical protein
VDHTRDKPAQCDDTLVEARLKEASLAIAQDVNGSANRSNSKAVYRQTSSSIGQLSYSTYLCTSYVSGEYTDRDHRGDPDGRAQLRPIEIEK